MGAHKRGQMVRAHLNWDPKVCDPTEGTEEEEEGWEEAGLSLARLCTPPLELTGWVEVPLCLGSPLRSPQSIP